MISQPPLEAIPMQPPDAQAMQAIAMRDTADVLYGATNTAGVPSAIQRAGVEAPVPLTSEVIASESRAVTGILQALEMRNPKHADAVAEVFATRLRSPMTPELLAQWEQDSNKELRAAFGDKAGDALAAAQKLARSIPGLNTRLKDGIGSHPKIVMLLANRALGRQMDGDGK